MPIVCDPKFPQRLPENTGKSEVTVINKRYRDAKVPINTIKKPLSNLYSCQGVLPYETRNEFNEVSQMVYIYKDGIKAQKKRNQLQNPAPRGKR